MLALGQAATAGAMFLLISTPPNFIAKRVIEEFIPEISLTFFDWFIVGSVHAFIGLIISWIITFTLIKIEVKELAIDGKLMEKRKALGPMSLGEKLVALIFILTISLWILPGLLLILANIYPEYTAINTLAKQYLPEVLPAILAMFLLGLIRVNGRPLLTWDDIETSIDWNVIFIFGGSIAMGKALQNSGFFRMACTYNY